MRPRLAMLSVPTLWIVFAINFLALGVVWTYIMRSYPKLYAARFWTAAAFVAAVGAAISLTRGSVNPLIPIFGSGGLLILSSCLGVMGIRQFYGEPVRWGITIATVSLTLLGLGVFALVYENMAARILVYSIGQSVPMLLVLPTLLSRTNGRASPGGRMTGYISILVIAVHTFRSGAAAMQIGGGLTLTDFNGIQAVMLVLLVFLSMAWNFGFILLAVDRLRAEVADLALQDDLTGVANRRQLLLRLSDACIQAQRTSEPFALLAIDLDGFKDINDTCGHAAGDECLRLFTKAAQMRLRAGDLLARSGGDEFTILLPGTTLREGAMIARHVLEACREQTASWYGTPIPLQASIGVAQWRPEIGRDPERLIAAADRALYTAKKDGKNGYAVFDVTPLTSEPPLRKSA